MPEDPVLTDSSIPERVLGMEKRKRLIKIFLLVCLLIPYLLYLAFIIQGDRGPVDYETFMGIGHRLLSGDQIYIENSYYPMPFNFIFAFLSWMPRPLSMAVWMLGPVILALFITGWNPWVLVFAPLFGHFVGGQSAVFGMLGLWGYRKYSNSHNALGGFFLALTLLKPQLGVIPLIYAGIQWLKEFIASRRIPIQTWVWCATMALLYLPGFLLLPDWLLQWTNRPRPLFERALSGIIPRILLDFLDPQTPSYWLILGGIGVFVFIGIWLCNRRKITLDLAVLWSFIVSPLMHDYDLIQLIPLLDKPALRAMGILLSIPGWFVILFAYQNDAAWIVFTFIAPGLLCVWLYLNRKPAKPEESVAISE